ncbi:hypothetical protein OH77DRAFT_1411677, partial [Trametes cingulata]
LLQDLRGALQELRSLRPPPSGALCTLEGGQVRLVRAGDRNILVPFSSQPVCKRALLELVHPMFSDRALALRCLAKPVDATQHHICFTHGLHSSNFIVKDGPLAGIIDWDTAGWLPEYWEFTSIEGHICLDPLHQQFWDAARTSVGTDPYQDELALSEYALWLSTGSSLMMGAIDLTCPRRVF